MMFRSEDAERIRRSIALLAPGHPSALDREAAMALLAELQRLQGKDRRIQQLLDELLHLLETARSVGNS
jgi:hypothetical protein